MLDSIVTVVDAKNIARQLRTHHSNALQATGADSGAQVTGAALARDSSNVADDVAAVRASADYSNTSPTASQAGEGRHAASTLSEPVNEAQQQLAYADVVLLNKTDLVSARDLDAIEQAIRRHNSAVKV